MNWNRDFREGIIIKTQKEIFIFFPIGFRVTVKLSFSSVDGGELLGIGGFMPVVGIPTLAQRAEYLVGRITSTSWPHPLPHSFSLWKEEWTSAKAAFLNVIRNLGFHLKGDESGVILTTFIDMLMIIKNCELNVGKKLLLKILSSHISVCFNFFPCDNYFEESTPTEDSKFSSASSD